jgi:hypothetical protein
MEHDLTTGPVRVYRHSIHWEYVPNGIAGIWDDVVMHFSHGTCTIQFKEEFSQL